MEKIFQSETESEKPYMDYKTKKVKQIEEKKKELYKSHKEKETKGEKGCLV